MGNNCLIGIFQFGKVKKVLEMDGDDGHPTTGMYLMLLNCTVDLNMVKMVSLVLCV